MTSSPQLFKHQEEYFDIPTADKTPLQIRESLIALASSVLHSAEAVERVRDLLAYKGSANGGNAVTDDLKYNSEFKTKTLFSGVLYIGI